MLREQILRNLLTALALAWLCFACSDNEQRRDRGATDPDAMRMVAETSLGPVTATLRMLPIEPRFGERVSLVLDVTASEAAELEPMTVGARLGHFRVRGQDREGDPARGRVRYTITADPEKSGVNICRMPAIPFRITSGEGAGTDRELRIAAFEVEVGGLAADARPDLADLGTPLGPVRLPPGASSGRPLWIGGGIVAVALFAFLLWWQGRRRSDTDRASEISPRDEAARAFDALLALRLVENGLLAEFYVRLTGIVRRYIERTTGVHAPEQTTEEFLRATEHDSKFEPEQRRRLNEFLRACDLVKFAAQVPSEAEIADAVGSARSFCELEHPSAEAAA